MFRTPLFDRVWSVIHDIRRSRTRPSATRRRKLSAGGRRLQRIEVLEDRTLLSSLSINDVSVVEGNAGTTNAVFTVTLSAPSTETVTVVASSSDGTASSLSDYTPLPPTTLTFNPGETSRSFSIAVNGDTIDEGDETFFVTLSAAVNATVADGQGVGTILDDDGAPPNPVVPALSINDVSLLEGNAGTTNAVFTVSLSAASSQTVTVVATSADGTATSGLDYTPLPPTIVTFNPGETSQTVFVSVNGDTADESDETFFVNLTTAVNATFADAQGMGSILDDDPTPPVVTPPTISINDVSVIEGNAGTINAVFTVTLSAASPQVVTVVAASADGSASSPSDYTPLPPTVLTFNPGETSRQVSVAVNGDTADESDENFFINLTTAVNATFADAQGVGTILDDDGAPPNPPTPSLSINDVMLVEGNAGATTAVFTITMSQSSSQTVTVVATSADGTATSGLDYTPLPPTIVTFNPGETSKTVSVSVSGDTADEANETFFVNLNAADNATIGDAQGLGTILDDDPAPPFPVPPTLSINDVSVVEGNAGTTMASFTVTLSAANSETVTVVATSADGTATSVVDYTPLPPTVLTFNPGETSKTVSVSVNGDTADESDETFFVNLTSAVNATFADAQGVGTILDDDGAPPNPPTPTLSINDVSLLEGNTGTTNAVFTITLSQASAQTITVVATSADGSAASPSDYTPLPPTVVTFNPGETSRGVSIAVNGDTTDEQNETFFVNLTTAVNANIADAQGMGTIIDDDPDVPVVIPPTVSINDVSVVEGDAGTTNATFTVTLSGASPQTVTVVVASADNTATSPSDYTPLPPTVLTFNPGETSRSFSIAVNGDVVDEADETFFVNITTSVNATIADGQGVGTILDDDGAPPNPATPSLSINDVSVLEGNTGTSNAVFTVTLSAASSQTVTVVATSADGTASGLSDYSPLPPTVVTFNPGETSRAISVAVNGDIADEPNETFFVNLTAAVNATFADAQGQGTILDDDPAPPVPIVPTVSINDVSVMEGNSGSTTAVFTVTLSAASPQTVTVVATSADNTATSPSDYTPLPPTMITFNPGETSKTISVSVSGDTADETDETFFVNLTAAVNATFADAQGVGTILDDDGAPPNPVTPTLSINDVSLFEGNSGTSNAAFTITLSQASAQTVTVVATSADGSATSPSDYTPLPPTVVTFNPGETSKTVSVSVNGDTTDEANETFFVNLTAAVNATFADAQGQGTILDDDPAPPVPIVPTVSINDVSVIEGNAGTINAVFTVSLSAASPQTVTVVAASADNTATSPGDYTPLPATVITFNPGETSKTVSISINGDTADESDETFFVNLNAAVNATFADAQGVGTILDDDGAPPNPVTPTLSINDVSLLEGNSGTSTAVFTITLSQASAQTVTVVATSADNTATSPSDYTPLPATVVTFNPGETTKTVSVSVNGDTADESNETFFVNLTAAVNANLADVQGLGTILDDDPETPIVIPPTVSINDVSVIEGNAGTVNAVFTVSLSGASPQTVTVVATSADNTATSPSDYTPLPATVVTFNPGETSKTVTVSVNGDVVDESDETFFVNLTAAVNATFADAQGVGTILDDDGAPPNPPTPTLSINDVSIFEGNSGTSSAVFTITLSEASAQTVTVVATSADGTATAASDYTPLPATVITFNPGEISKTVSISVSGDTVNEANETFFINLTAAVNANLADNQGQGTILNDDVAPTISINDVAVIEATGAGTVNAVFTVSLSTASAQTVTVIVASSDGTATGPSDYVPLPPTLVTFAPGEVAKTITVAVNGDNPPEPNETFFVNLSNATNAAITRSPGVGTILDNDVGFGSVRMLRAYNRGINFHFFTTSTGEFTNAVANGYEDENMGRLSFNVHTAQYAGTTLTALHRLYNPNKGSHYYTVNSQERDFLVSVGWIYEHDEGFVYTTQPAGGRATTLYRLYNVNSGVHLYTASAAQKNAILGQFPGVWFEHSPVGFAFLADGNGNVLPRESAQTALARRAAAHGEKASSTSSSGFASSDQGSDSGTMSGSSLNPGLLDVSHSTNFVAASDRAIADGSSSGLRRSIGSLIASDATEAIDDFWTQLGRGLDDDFSNGEWEPEGAIH